MQKPFLNLPGALITLIFMSILGSAQAADPQDIVIYGATGNIGSVITQEALDRGHNVTGISRDPSKFERTETNFTAAAGDIMDLDSVLGVIEGADVVIVSVHGVLEPYSGENTVQNHAAKTIIAAVERLGSDAPRVIQVGGGSTLHRDGVVILETMDRGFDGQPIVEGTEMHAMLWGHQAALETYLASDIDWTVITPPLGIIGPGDRTGEFRISEDEVLVGENGRGAISRADFAVALLDEIEEPRFVRDRFTVSY